jgi:GntR family transcriptional regulator
MAVSRISRVEEVERALLSRLHELAGPEGRLPTEPEIAKMFNVSRTTVRAAVGALVARGLVIRRQGMGSFVLQPSRIANPLDEAVDFRELIQRNHCCPDIHFLSTTLVTLDEALTTALDQPDRTALRRHTLFTADGDPVIYCINTIPLRVMPEGLTQQVMADPAISEPIYDFLAQRCDQPVELSRATMWPDIARNCDIQGARVDPLMPVLVLEEIGYSGAGRPVLHSLEYYPGRFMRFEVIRRRGVSREWVKS